MKKISVCIPTYNQGDYVAFSVRSAANQTVKPFEIIVSNDCSTDGKTKEVLDALEKEIDCLRVIHQPKNLGITGNTNECLKAAKGDYILRLDSDDILDPAYVQEVSALLDKYPEAGYGHANVLEINSKNEVTRKRTLFRKAEYIDANQALKDAIKGYRVAANILMFRREALERVGFITCKENFAEDYYLSAQLAALGYGNVFSEKYLSNYRVWDDGKNVRVKRKMDEIKGLKAVFNEVLIPAFKERNWGLAGVYSAMESFAVNHASCLGWKVYNRQEKKDISALLIQLSDTAKTKRYIWLYMNNLAFLPDGVKKVKNYLVSIVKKILR